MEFEHFPVIAGPADLHPDIPEESCQAVRFVHIDAVRMDPVLVHGPEQLEGEIHSRLVFRLDLRARFGVDEIDAIDSGRILHLPSRDCLDQALFGEVHIISVIGNAAVQRFFFDIYSHCGRAYKVYVDLIDKRDVRHGPVVVF